MSPEDQFSPAIHSREIVHGQTKQYLKLQEVCANRSAQDSRTELRGGAVLGPTSWKRERIAGDGEEEKGFPGKVSFSSVLQSHINSPACFASNLSHCWSVLLAACGQEKEGTRRQGLQETRTVGTVVGPLGDWQGGLGDGKMGLGWLYKAVLRKVNTCKGLPIVPALPPLPCGFSPSAVPLAHL